MNQKMSILIALKQGMKISSLDALSMWGCFRLAARIGELREEGYPIKSEMTLDETTGKNYAVYWMGGK